MNSKLVEHIKKVEEEKKRLDKLGIKSIINTPIKEITNASTSRNTRRDND
jgi:hypothetical protein